MSLVIRRRYSYPKLLLTIKEIVDQCCICVSILIEESMSRVREYMQRSIRMAYFLPHKDAVFSRYYSIIRAFAFN